MTGKTISLAEFRRLWASDMTVGQIAEYLGVTRSAVQFRAKRRGLPPKARILTYAPRPPRDVMARMWLAGVRLTDIAAHFGMTYGLAVKLVREFGLPLRPVGGQVRANMVRLEDYLAMELRLALQAAAQAEAPQLRLAEMVDSHSGQKRVA